MPLPDCHTLQLLDRATTQARAPHARATTTRTQDTLRHRWAAALQWRRTRLTGGPLAENLAQIGQAWHRRVHADFLVADPVVRDRATGPACVVARCLSGE
eukprot:CAMPEP_0181213052 /NCGR_PEP_ID=MMETSP1096-20121128/24691_1 /TAXON_ID=156174 ORGANISM="Chrysochromulina ericina, Strain CCMP281" /NCGR_SAMPLE_ID=MMETSP1096 /ASSEMBLY_ACC=CAM_ASM_000453 /LENGTH=99 /DNA_ID=CAMNT_0023304649 /DNA_START=184 /DNA_END=484 /DNA_ORIENTATION=+